MLATLDDSSDALLWTERLVERWQQGRDPKTGLCGGQLSYREHDRAQDALGHVHPTINEAKMVVSYHQSSRYHDLPLVQMQAAEVLRQAGDARYAGFAQRLIDTASEDLKTYARECYDAESGQFIGRMTDGTAIQWKEAKTGYYVPESFAPRGPNGELFWGYALAYRLTGDEAHKQMVDELGTRLGLWSADAIGEPTEPFECSDWRLIYALLELEEATGDAGYLKLARLVGDNLAQDTGRFRAVSPIAPGVCPDWGRYSTGIASPRCRPFRTPGRHSRRGFRSPLLSLRVSMANSKSIRRNEPIPEPTTTTCSTAARNGIRRNYRFG